MLLLLLGCGSPGTPLPPSLHLPQPVQDLRATRKGDVVTLTWTQPSHTTDKDSIRQLGQTLVCRDVSPSAGVPPANCSQPAGKVPPQPVPRSSGPNPPTPVAASFSEKLPVELQTSHPAWFALYAVQVQNPRGRSAGFSNAVSVPLAPTLEAPSKPNVEVRADGIHLFSSGNLPAVPAELARPELEFFYRLSRQEEPPAANAALVVIAETPAGSAMQVVDHSFEWEKHYSYNLTPITRVKSASGSAEVQGEDSPAVEVFAHDIFPPAAPSGVEAVFSGNPQNVYIDLTWAANTESDLAGYNVYRRRAGESPARINSELIPTPSFRDTQVAAGNEYFYSVSAVDLRHNESPRSAETSESVPSN